jgi:hypothetical protein
VTPVLSEADRDNSDEARPFADIGTLWIEDLDPLVDPVLKRAVLVAAPFSRNPR